MKLKKGDKVKCKENHPYLGVSKRHIGIIDSLERQAKANSVFVYVQFKHRANTIIFQSSELTKQTR